MNVETGEAEGFAARLKQVVRDHRNTSSLAKAIGRSEGALRNWLTRRSEPTVSNVIAICRATGTRVEWLMIGRGHRREVEVGEVRELDVPYRAASAPALDEALLRAIAEAVERETRTQSIKLTPEKKAGLIAHCYSFMGQVAAFDPQAVARLVKLTS
jgi:DNA-binding phage protein